MKKLMFPICIILTVLIVVVSMTTVSFSWFTPDSASGVGLQFSETTSVRSENCTIVTYKGTNNNGVITYDNSPVGSNSETVSSSGSGENLEAGIAYYKTVIVNNNVEYDTNVSLYLPAFTVNNVSASIGVATPTNTYRTFTESVDDVHIIRNAFISAYSHDKAGSGSLSVEWFVKCDDGSATFNPSQVYLTYN